MGGIKRKVPFMRVSNKDLEAINELANNTLGGNRSVVPADLRIAVLHVRWLSKTHEDRAESWFRFYRGRFKKIGIEFPAMGKDFRAVTSVETVKTAQSSPNVGRPSARPDYCTHPEAKECGRCPSRWGRWWDCTGRPVSGSWGVSYVVDGKEVRAGKPADGKPIRGCYFQGGFLWKDGKAVKVPRGVSVAYSEEK